MLSPLRFEPIFRRYLWGGRRLATVLGKALRPGDDYAESWEICDHGDDQSIVTAGPMRGWTLARLVAERGAQLFGCHHPQPRFPLLFKFLDAQQTLSVQVHPDDVSAARLDPPDLGKTEAWVVIEAKPGSLIYAGLKRGFDRAALARELNRGTCELCLERFTPSAGDCMFIPAGTVHALGEGLLVAEIQQSSDTTYRLFDWNRVGPDGRPRELHVERALDVIDFGRPPVELQVPQPTDRPHISRLVTCEKFVLERWDFAGVETAGGDERFHILSVLDGAIDVAGDPTGAPLATGGTILLPASAGAVTLGTRGRAVVLDAYLP